MELRFTAFRAVAFDRYGKPIDWERGFQRSSLAPRSPEPSWPIRRFQLATNQKPA
jgi:hypothetical protein